MLCVELSHPLSEQLGGRGEARLQPVGGAAHINSYVGLGRKWRGSSYLLGGQDRCSSCFALTADINRNYTLV